MRGFFVAVLLVLTLPGVQIARAQGERPIAIVRALAVNIRSAPGADSPIIGQLRRGARFWVTAVTPDYGWLYFSYWGKDAYVTANADLISVSVPLSDLPGATLGSNAPLSPGSAQIVLSDYAVNPAVPAPGAPFQIVLTLKNTGSIDAGLFSVAASLAPSGAFVWAPVAKLGAGESGVVTLDDPGEQSTGQFSIRVALDVDNSLGSIGPDSLPEITYRIDRPYIAQASIDLQPFTNIDLHGGTPDLALALDGLSAMNGAKIAVLDGLTLASVHYDLLERIGGRSVPSERLKPGALIGLKTAEGRRGLLRIVAYDGRVMGVQYFIYAK